MKEVMEEYGGLLLAVIASTLALVVNISVFLGPMATQITYLANGQ